MVKLTEFGAPTYRALRAMKIDLLRDRVPESLEHCMHITSQDEKITTPEHPRSYQSGLVWKTRTVNDFGSANTETIRRLDLSDSKHEIP